MERPRQISETIFAFQKCCVLLLGRGIRSEKIQLRTRIPQGKNIKTSGEEAKFV